MMRVVLAYSDYVESKEKARACGRPHSVTIRLIESKHRLRPKQLLNFMANEVYRKGASDLAKERL